MTLPDEKLHAIHQTRDFLRDLTIAPFPGIRVIRKRALACLRHYPWELDEAAIGQALGTAPLPSADGSNADVTWHGKGFPPDLQAEIDRRMKKP